MPLSKFVSKTWPKWLLCIRFSKPSTVFLFSIPAHPALLMRICNLGSFFTTAANSLTESKEAKSSFLITILLFPDFSTISSKFKKVCCIMIEHSTVDYQGSEVYI
jgi:hypothetical protein